MAGRKLLPSYLLPNVDRTRQSRATKNGKRLGIPPSIPPRPAQCAPKGLPSGLLCAEARSPRSTQQSSPHAACEGSIDGCSPKEGALRWNDSHRPTATAARPWLQTEGAPPAERSCPTGPRWLRRRPGTRALSASRRAPLSRRHGSCHATATSAWQNRHGIPSGWHLSAPQVLGNSATGIGVLGITAAGREQHAAPGAFHLLHLPHGGSIELP